jgi:HrpA-like RNA helicase
MPSVRLVDITDVDPSSGVSLRRLLGDAADALQVNVSREAKGRFCAQATVDLTAHVKAGSKVPPNVRATGYGPDEQTAALLCSQHAVQLFTAASLNRPPPLPPFLVVTDANLLAFSRAQRQPRFVRESSSFRHGYGRGSEAPPPSDRWLSAAQNGSAAPTRSSTAPRNRWLSEPQPSPSEVPAAGAPVSRFARFAVAATPPAEPSNPTVPPAAADGGLPPSSSWNAEVEATEAVINRQRARDNLGRIQQLKAPLSGNHAVDTAAAMAEKAGPLAWSVALSLLSARLSRNSYVESGERATGRELIEGFQLVHYPNNVWVALRSVESTGHTAYGVSSNRREALGRALLHASSIERSLAVEQAKGPIATAPSSANGGPSTTARDDSKNAAATPQGTNGSTGATATDLKTPAPDVIDRLLRLHAKTAGHASPSWRAVDPASVPQAGKYHTCGVELSYAGMVSYGTASSVTAAQDVALRAVHEDLHAVDSDYRAFLTAMTAEGMDTESLRAGVDLDMSPAIVERIEVFARPIASEAREKAERRRAAVAAASSAGGSSDPVPGTARGGRESSRSPLYRAASVDKRAAAAEADEVRVRLMTSPRRASFSEKRASLPIAGAHHEIIEALERQRVVVVCGTTGSGKSTQVPQYLLEHHLKSPSDPRACRIVMTQPRRISAITIAERIADEMGQSAGLDVGYAVRLHATPGRCVNVVTTGVMLQTVKSDPVLDGLDYLIVDEVHDRSIECDLILGFAKAALAANPRLRLVVMSATLQAATFSEYFGGCAVVNIDARLFPVQELFLDDLQRTQPRSLPPVPPAELDRFSARGGYRGGRRPGDGAASEIKLNVNLAAWAVAYAVDTGAASESKSVLVFLPGWKEMQDLRRVLGTGSFAGGKRLRLHTILLHSTVDKDLQLEAFRPAPPGLVKVVIATNIAESGITIDDVGVVIDSGLVREMATTWSSSDSTPPDRGGTMANHNNGRAAATKGSEGTPKHAAAFGAVNQLSVVYTSRASCTQRLGRAGRTAGGVCIRLFTRARFNALADFATPEVLRSPLETTLLRLAAMGVAVSPFMSGLISPPPRHHVHHACHRLGVLGALEDWRGLTANPSADIGRLTLTTLGRWLSRIPVEPSLAKLIVLGAALGCFDAALTIAACSEQTPFLTAKDVAKEVKAAKQAVSDLSGSDHLAAVYAYNTAAFAPAHERERTIATLKLQATGITNISRYKEQFRSIVAEGGVAGRDRAPVEYAKSPADYFRGLPLFVDSGPQSVPECMNTRPLLRALIAAGLYPNLGCALSRDRPKKRGGGGGNAEKQQRGIRRIRTRHFKALDLGSSSVVRVDTKDPQSSKDPFVVFDSLVRLDGKTPMATGVTQCSLWGVLLLAAGPGHVEYNSKIGIGALDGWLHTEADVRGGLRSARRALRHVRPPHFHSSRSAQPAATGRTAGHLHCYRLGRGERAAARRWQ